MKKAFAIILVLAMALTLWACSLFTSTKAEDAPLRPGLIDETEGDGTGPVLTPNHTGTTPDPTEGTEEEPSSGGSNTQGTTAPTTAPTAKPTTAPTTKPTTKPTAPPTTAPATKPPSSAAPEAPVLPGDIPLEIPTK